MNRDEIISLGVTPQIAKSIETYLKMNMPVGQRSGEATVLVSNEGCMTGWYKAAELVGNLATPQIEATHERKGLYSEEAPR